MPETVKIAEERIFRRNSFFCESRRISVASEHYDNDKSLFDGWGDGGGGAVAIEGARGVGDGARRRCIRWGRVTPWPDVYPEDGGREGIFR